MSASLVASCFNDSFVAAKDAADGLFNLVTIVGKRRAVEFHNVLVDCLCEEAEEWLADATAVSTSFHFLATRHKYGTFGDSARSQRQYIF